MNKYDERHGGPFDRGAADSYYNRPKEPHYYAGGTGTSLRIPQADMTFDDVLAYNAGYDENERQGNKKEY